MMLRRPRQASLRSRSRFHFSMKKPSKEKGARAKLRVYFLDNIGKVLTSKDLQKVAGISEWARRVRELRNQEGFQILTHNDRDGLKPREYLLEDPKPQPAFSRSISKELRALVLDRNGFTCQMCGAVAGEKHAFDGRVTRLHLGHVVDKSQGGEDTLENLRALCSVCNEGASNLTLDRPSASKLLIQVRRAKREDQLQVLEWLKAKFE